MKRMQIIADSDYGYWRDFLELSTTGEQDYACLKLEAAGKRFLVDFGYQNAEEKLRIHRAERRIN